MCVFPFGVCILPSLATDIQSFCEELCTKDKAENSRNDCVHYSSELTGYMLKRTVICEQPKGQSPTENTESEDKNMTEYEMQDSLMGLVLGEQIDTTMLEGASVRTFEDAGVMTYDKGLVITTEDGSEFQITICQSR